MRYTCGPDWQLKLDPVSLLSLLTLLTDAVCVRVWGLRSNQRQEHQHRQDPGLRGLCEGCASALPPLPSRTRALLHGQGPVWLLATRRVTLPLCPPAAWHRRKPPVLAFTDSQQPRRVTPLTDASATPQRATSRSAAVTRHTPPWQCTHTTPLDSDAEQSRGLGCVCVRRAVEMRGEDGMVKARTALGKWDDANNVKFDETLRLCVPPHHNSLSRLTRPPAELSAKPALSAHHDVHRVHALTRSTCHPTLSACVCAECRRGWAGCTRPYVARSFTRCGPRGAAKTSGVEKPVARSARLWT